VYIEGHSRVGSGKRPLQPFRKAQAGGFHSSQLDLLNRSVITM